MKWVQACRMTNAQWVEHQFFYRISTDENKKRPDCVRCWTIFARVLDIPQIISFCNIKEVNDHKKNRGQTIMHRK